MWLVAGILLELSGNLDALGCTTEVRRGERAIELMVWGLASRCEGDGM
jgi:hypothetical protein